MRFFDSPHDRPEGGWLEFVPRPAGSVIHMQPPAESVVMPCCGRRLFDVPTIDQLTREDFLVTCQGGVR